MDNKKKNANRIQTTVLLKTQCEKITVLVVENKTVQVVYVNLFGIKKRKKKMAFRKSRKPIIVVFKMYDVLYALPVAVERHVDSKERRCRK